MRTSKLLILLSLFFLFIAPSSIVRGETKTSSFEGKDKIKVYYFHNTRRCATCNAVETLTKEALDENFSSLVNDGSIGFISLNLEKKKGKSEAKKLEINGQTLLFVSGNNKVDLTSVAFMNALAKPEKLKSKVKETVTKMLE